MSLCVHALCIYVCTYVLHFLWLTHKVMLDLKKTKRIKSCIDEMLFSLQWSLSPALQPQYVPLQRQTCLCHHELQHSFTFEIKRVIAQIFGLFAPITLEHVAPLLCWLHARFNQFKEVHDSNKGAKVLFFKYLNHIYKLKSSTCNV